MESFYFSAVNTLISKVSSTSVGSSNQEITVLLWFLLWINYELISPLMHNLKVAGEFPIIVDDFLSQPQQIEMTCELNQICCFVKAFFLLLYLYFCP